MGKLIWHQYARYVSIIASFCMSLHPTVATRISPPVQLLFGPVTLVSFIANFSGTFLVVFYEIPVVYSEPVCSLHVIFF
jgi:hypothetical protein